jgi:D-sedoheptulose 7-phosphate isomerase|tara:strand:+ start:85 stop:720 length:636 start_codon:yes stop_codon:yes gene_type:complete
MDIEIFVNMYLNEKKDIIENYPIKDVVRATEMVFHTYEKEGTIFSMGNGGNAGTVDHLYCDFKHHAFVSEDKTKPLPQQIKRLSFRSLCGSTSELTGLVNDLGPEMMFAGALAPDVKSDDLVMGFSGSGNSKNVVRAFEVAKLAGAKTLAITKGSGGLCKEIADICIIIPGESNFPGQTGKNDNNFHFEDAVLTINHMIVGLLKHKVSSLI